MARQMVLTKQYFDKVSKTFARKVDLNQTNKVLDRIVATLAQTNQTLDRVVEAQNNTTATVTRATASLANLIEDFREFKEDMKNVPSMLDSHTTTLDKIFRNSELSKTETTALQNAVKRHEQWITQIADKVGIKLES